MAKRNDLPFEEPIVHIREEIKKLQRRNDEEARKEEKRLMEELKKEWEKLVSSLSRWQKTLLARHPQRPYTLDYIYSLFDDFVELHGDRRFADDPAIVAGFGFYHGESVAIIGHQKGRTTQERIRRNFGQANPEGYRKALRIMKLAEKFNRPIITFIDTPGAYPGIGSEERGQAEAIAYNLREMAGLRVPTISVVIGEGGSGGALGIGVTDRILMLQFSIYSVISPEGCAAILWRNQEAVEEAAENLKLTAEDLYKFGIADELIPEPLGGAHSFPEIAYKNVDKALQRHLKELKEMDPEERIEKRYQKFKNMGVFLEGSKTGRS